MVCGEGGGCCGGGCLRFADRGKGNIVLYSDMVLMIVSV